MPEYLMKRLRVFNSLDRNDKRFDDEILSRSKPDLFEELLEYEGIEGYGGIILSWIEEIWGTKLE